MMVVIKEFARTKTTVAFSALKKLPRAGAEVRRLGLRLGELLQFPKYALSLAVWLPPPPSPISGGR